jgi:hypothetical protein
MLMFLQRNPSVLFAFVVILYADKAKYLDVTIQSDLKWDSHINNITTKANKTFGFLRRNINISSTKVKEQAYSNAIINKC